MKQPYKYLDYFTEEDGDIFFGREKEIDILLSDIIVSRLVVLFAKTGTGKTSLIRAGVSPRLTRLGYTTIYTQVKEDPYESLGQALSEQGIPRSPQDSIPAQMELASRHLSGRPIVIFFDQFEEFFFGVERRDSEKARQFIQDIAEVYLGRKQRVHMVFSLREDFYYGMNSFRGKIPTIFHNDSNLHLLPLDELQARRAITGPAEREGSGFTIEDALVDQLVRDLASLSEGERIEPAQLQIICDTLWQPGTGEARISLEKYESLGGTKGILATRIQDDLGRNLTNEQLDQFERLVDFLTDRKHEVKRPRQFSEVADYLKQDPDQVKELVGKLKGVGILRERTLEDVQYVEWITDYVAKNVQDLENAVRAISTKKKHEAFLDHCQLASTRQDLDEVTRIASRLPEEFGEISSNVNLLSLDREKAEFMFLRSLEYDLAKRTWFDTCEKSGVDVWSVLRDRIDKENPTIEDSLQASHAVQLLGELYADPRYRERAMELLHSAMNNRNLTGAAIKVLGAADTPEAVEELRQAARQDDLVAVVINSLAVNEAAIQLLQEILQRELGKESLQALEIAGRLHQISLGRPGRTTNSAQRFFREAVENNGLEFFHLALRYGVEMVFWFTQALQSGTDVWKTLEESIHQPEEIQKARNAVRLLGELSDPRAVELLESALGREDLAGDVEMSLRRIREKKDVDLETSDQAVKLLKRLKGQAKQPQGKEARRYIESYFKESTAGPSQNIFDTLAHALKQGRFLPFLGPGVAPQDTPRLSEIARQWANIYEYPFADHDELAKVASYIAVQQDHLFTVDLLVRELEKWSLNDPPVERDPYRLLVELPVPIYMTTEYHELLERALTEAGKIPKSASIRLNENGRERDSIDWDAYYPTVSEPLVYHLYGQISEPDTILLTEEDFLDFVVHTSKDSWLIPPVVRKSYVSSSVVYLGVDVADTSLQTLYRQGESRLRSHVIVLLWSKEIVPEEGAKLRYLEYYLKNRDINVYWGTAGDFLIDLRDHFKT